MNPVVTASKVTLALSHYSLEEVGGRDEGVVRNWGLPPWIAK